MDRRAMIVRVLAVLVLLLLPVTAWAQGPRMQEPEQSRPWAVYFSPDDGARAVVEALGRARKSVRVLIFATSSPPVTRALIDAHQRGVSVEVIQGGKPAKGRQPSAASLAQAGIAILTDKVHTSTGSNVMVIDHHIVLTGAFGSASAGPGPSAETLLVISDPTMAARYGENWEAHAAHSVRSPAS